MPPRLLRRRVVGISMIVSAVLSLATAVVLPPNRGDVGAQVATVATAPTRFVIANLIALVSLILLVPATLGLIHVLRDRKPRLALAGGALALAGVMPVAVQIALGLVEWKMVSAGADRHEMVALLDRVEFSLGFVPILLAAVMPAVGLSILAFGLHRTRLAPAWVAACAAFGAVGLDVGFEMPSLAIRIGSAVLTVVAFAWLGRAVLRGEGQWGAAAPSASSASAAWSPSRTA